VLIRSELFHCGEQDESQDEQDYQKVKEAETPLRLRIADCELRIAKSGGNSRSHRYLSLMKYD